MKRTHERQEPGGRHYPPGDEECHTEANSKNQQSDERDIGGPKPGR